MVTKAVLTRSVKITRHVSVSIPNGLTAEYVVAALNSKAARENFGKFIICPDTFSVAIDGNVTEDGGVLWQVESSDEPSITEGADSSSDYLRAIARRDTALAAEEDRLMQLRWQIDSLNRSAMNRVMSGDFNESRKFCSAASVLAALLGEHDCSEIVWLLSVTSYNATAAKHHKSAWRSACKGLRMARRLHKPQDHTLGTLLANAGEGRIDAGDYKLAERLLTEGIEELDKAAAAGGKDSSLKLARADAVRNYERLQTLKSQTV